MADFDFGGLLGNLGSAFSGGGPGALDEYLTPEQKAAMQRNAMLQASAALLKAGGRSTTRTSLGQALGQALEAGQGGYEKGQTNAMQQILLKQKMDETKNLSAMRREIPGLFQTTTTPASMETTSVPSPYPSDAEDNLTFAGKMIPGQQTTNIDQSKLMRLAQLSTNPIETLSQISKLVPEMRIAGLMGTSGAQENPFSVFIDDETVPATVKNIARQYAASFKAGTLDPTKVDDRVRTLNEMAQRVQTSAEVRAGTEAQRAFMQGMATQNAEALQANRDMLASLRQQGLEQSAEGRRLTNLVAQGQLDVARQTLALRQSVEAGKPPQFSYAQKKEYDVVAGDKDAAKQAEESADLAAKAALLIPQAYGSRIESGAKSLLGFAGFSTEAKNATDSLQRINQQLALKTPKFKGPTSDADAKRYDQAVGDLANPSKSIASKNQALMDIQELAAKQRAFASQQENYFDTNKTLRGFTFNPFGQ